MSSDNSSSSNNNKPPSPPPADMQRNRRGSLSANNPFSTLFNRSNSIATGTPVFPSAITTAAIQEQQRRRLSLSTTTALGMTGTSPTSATGLARRASTSTSSDFDENAIEEEDSAATRAIPSSPFTRRMSFGNPATMRRPGGNSPGSGNDQGYNWSEQLRSRAESSVSGSRPSFSFASGLTGSPPRPGMPSPGSHDRARSVSEMPPPPAQAPKPRSPPRADPRPKPDHFQERILKGDFYMD